MKLRILPIILFVLTVVLFFAPFIFQNRLPLPADTIIGLYHPFRDLYSKDYPNGIPYKNFLITDPVRQQFPWRNLVVNSEKKFELPLWNPYSFAGSPLLANFQSAAFYPLNILLFILPFKYGWSILILLQPMMAGIFMYLYLRNLNINKPASFLGSFSFAFSGFSVAWLEWGTVGQTGLWLPLVLLSIDRICSYRSSLRAKRSNLNGIAAAISWLRNDLVIWSLVFLFSLVSSFFAGHLQTFFYLFIVSMSYLVFRLWGSSNRKSIITTFLILNSCFLILTMVQWLPTLQLIFQSARGIDQIWQRPGWFIPWQNAIQFVAPDFFGNPATLNYWGEFNYAEFVGYIGILPLSMSIFALFLKRNRQVLFFAGVLLLSILFSFPTIFAKIPYALNLPFISTSQPTRLLFLTDFALSILAAYGFDLLMKKTITKKQFILPLLLLATIFILLWYFILKGHELNPLISAENISVAKRNMYFPTLIFALSSTILVLHQFLKKQIYKNLCIAILIALTIFDIFRFFNKFTPFTTSSYLFPNSKSINFLHNQTGQFRIMSLDDRILPPNFSVMYNLSSIDGYDPLYLMRYAELITAMERGRPDIRPPFGFNRIITPSNFDSKIVDLMGVKYILSLSDLNSPKLEKVFAEGQTKVYKNNKAHDRAFFVDEILVAKEKNDSIKKIFDPQIDFKSSAVVEGYSGQNTRFTKGTVNNVKYKGNNVQIEVKNEDEGFLVLMDTFYPTWKAEICTTELTDCDSTKIYLTNFNFRGVLVPKGSKTIVLTNSLL